MFLTSHIYINGMNQEFFNFLNGFSLQNIFLDSWIIFYAENLGIILVIFFVLFHLFSFLYPKGFGSRDEISQHSFRAIYMVLISSTLIFFISQIINHFYFSPRPFLVLDNVSLLFTHGANDSFPSGHATALFSLAFMSLFYSPRVLSLLLFIGASVVGISRVVAGVHWPLDILGGIVLAAVGSSLIKLLLTRFRKNK